MREHGMVDPAVRQLMAGGARGDAAERPVLWSRAVDRTNDAARCRINGSAAGMLPGGAAIAEHPADREVRRPVPRCHDGD